LEGLSAMGFRHVVANLLSDDLFPSRFVSCKADQRGKANELIIRNYTPTSKQWAESDKDGE
jgi:hypothetical protein